MMTGIDGQRTDESHEHDAAGGGGAGDPAARVVPRPATSPAAADSRNLGVIAHLSAFAALAGVPSFIGPLVVWLLHRDRDAFVADHAREALNFNLSLLLYAGAAVALSIVTIGLGLLVVIPTAIVAAVAWLVLTVLAAVRAADGDTYRYPLTLRLVH